MIEEKKDRAEWKCNIIIKGIEINRERERKPDLQVKIMLKVKIASRKDMGIGTVKEIKGAEEQMVIVQMKSWKRREIMGGQEQSERKIN